MGQKTHPFGFRVGITETHKSRWFAPKALFGELLVEDYRIRKYVDKRLNRTPPFAAVSDILVEREEAGRYSYPPPIPEYSNLSILDRPPLSPIQQSPGGAFKHV